jgi:hypothetical protein
MRLYGAPAIFPQARVVITIHDHSHLHWYFVWPEYWVFLASFIVVCIAALADRRIPFLALPFLGCFLAFVVFLDTNWVSTRVRKIFKDLQNTKP